MSDRILPATIIDRTPSDPKNILINNLKAGDVVQLPGSAPETFYLVLHRTFTALRPPIVVVATVTHYQSHNELTIETWNDMEGKVVLLPKRVSNITLTLDPK